MRANSMWINRIAYDNLNDKLTTGKVVVLYGPRRSGKTTLVQKLLSAQKGKVYTGTGDDIQLRDILSSEDKNLIVNAFFGYDLVFIDEAQRIPEIGWGLKILIDHNPDLKVVVTGSSSFQLSSQVSEPLTGRMWTIFLFPVSVKEFSLWHGNMELLQKLDDYLIYGTYPEVLTAQNHALKREYLLELRNSYLFKDILELENIRNASKLNNLLKLLAFQIGHEVSLNELANSLNIAKQTVERYLDLLEKTFIIKKLSGFSRNLRKEVTKTSRYYFLDNGVRNSIINNFNLLDTRNDLGQLWENFCFIERIKKQEYDSTPSNNFFWRTYDQQEIDLVEERDGNLFGYEFKWNHRKKVKVPVAWANAYPDAGFKSVNPRNFLDFLL